MTPQRALIAALLGGLAMAARLPFLLSQRIPFDSDEAVEGLMARHVLNGEFPVFLWGQPYKGVPEVYIASGAFSLFGSGVATLKSVTLVFFAIYVALNFLLLEKLCSRDHGVSSSLLLVAGPPALVFWSLSASAEYVLMMLLGTIVLLLYVEWEQRRSRSLVNWIAFVTGFALWVHQIFVFYLAPLVLIWLTRASFWEALSPKQLLRYLFRPLPGNSGVHIAVRILAALATMESVMAVVAFLTGGVTYDLGVVSIAARSPQKLLQLAIAFAALAVIVANFPRITQAGVSNLRGPVLAFVAGYLPVVLYSIFVQLPRSPARRGRLPELIAAAPDLAGNIVPIILGIKSPTTERLPIPAAALLPAIVAMSAYVWTRRHLVARLLSRRPLSVAEAFFPLFLVWIIILFVISGAYIDTQSYRYLVPIYAVLVVVWVSGSEVVSRGRRALAWVLVALIAGTHAWQQVLWYRKLAPDTGSIAVVDCLRAQSIRGGYADYWTSYKLTFLSDEQVIIAPMSADRYPPYSRFVESLPVVAAIDEDASQIRSLEEFVERERFACGDRTAVILERRAQER